MHFLSDVLVGVLVAVASLDLKVSNFSEKDVVTRRNDQLFEVLSFGHTNTQVSKWLRKEGTAFALQMAKPLRGSDDHVEWRSRYQ